MCQSVSSPLLPLLESLGRTLETVSQLAVKVFESSEKNGSCCKQGCVSCISDVEVSGPVTVFPAASTPPVVAEVPEDGSVLISSPSEHGVSFAVSTKEDREPVLVGEPVTTVQDSVRVPVPSVAGSAPVGTGAAVVSEHAAVAVASEGVGEDAVGEGWDISCDEEPVFIPSVSSVTEVEPELEQEPEIEPGLEPNLEPNLEPDLEPNLGPTLEPGIHRKTETEVRQEPNLTPHMEMPTTLGTHRETEPEVNPGRHRETTPEPEITQQDIQHLLDALVGKGHYMFVKEIANMYNITNLTRLDRKHYPDVYQRCVNYLTEKGIQL